jgi:serine/threonine protein kinase
MEVSVPLAALSERTSSHNLGTGAERHLGYGPYALDCFFDGFYQNRIDTVLKELYPCDIGSSKRIIRELEIWNNLKHQNIVKFYGIVKPAYNFNSKDSVQLSFLLERCHCSLHEHISVISKDYPGIMMILEILRDIVDGMVYVHAQKVVHLDLHSNNILLIRQPSDSRISYYRAKISDFGLSRQVYEDKENSDDLIGSISSNTFLCQLIAPPEAEEDNPKLGFKTDVYAFGIVLWEILTLHDLDKWAAENHRDPLGGVITSLIENKPVQVWRSAWEKYFSSLQGFSFLESANPKDSKIFWTLLEICVSCLSEDCDSRPHFTDIQNLLPR